MQCDYIMSNDDIKEIYDSVTSHNLETSFLRPRCEDKESKNIKVDIKINNEELTSLNTPVQREFYQEKKLYNQENYGKVVEHMTFIINEKYRRQGIAKSIHESELKIYRKNGFKQIQLSAVHDGVLVWSKLLYKYKDNKDEKKIFYEFLNYLKVVHLLSMETISSKKFKSKSLKDINIKYLLAPSEDKDSFSVWLTKRLGSIGIDMYKDIT